MNTIDKLHILSACLVVTAVFFIFVGCKSTPTTDQVYNTSYACGISAGMVCDQIEKVDEVRDTVVEVVKACREVTPMPGASFAKAWRYEAEVVTARLIDAGKIDQGKASLIEDCAYLLGEGLDYGMTLFPDSVKRNAELVQAAVNGGCDGFLTVFKPTDNKIRSVEKLNVLDALKDDKAYELLRAKASKSHKLNGVAY